LDILLLRLIFDHIYRINKQFVLLEQDIEKFLILDIDQ